MKTGIISIPTPINFDKNLHDKDRVTRWLKPKDDLKFIKSAIERLLNDHTEPYIVQKDSEISICRPNLRPKITQHPERHHYFALQNTKSGNILVAGKNLRQGKCMIPVLKSTIRNNPRKQQILRDTRMTAEERCKQLGYALLKQDKPFK
ncbi:MAG: hypothetical protein V3W20_00600 [Candidatus Neomarinimicrobiota bacterium]